MATPRFIYRRRAPQKNASKTTGAFVAPTEVHRKCDECEKDDKDKTVQRQALNTAPVTSSVNSFIPASGGNNLPTNTQQFFAARMGQDFSDVQIHTGSEAEEKAQAINAKAYTVGNHIVFNEGQYNTESQDGKKLLAHELTHVMQQNGQNQQIQRDMACCGEAYQLPQKGYDFNINEEILFQHTFCTNTKHVRLSINADWVTPHAAAHYQVQVYEENTSESFTRRYDVGKTETQHFNFKKTDKEGCNFFRIVITVYDPAGSPNLKGKADINP